MMILLMTFGSLYLAVMLLCIVSLCRAAAECDEWQREVLDLEQARAISTDHVGRSDRRSVAQARAHSPSSHPA